jgi:hypothetical protein
LTVVLLRTKVAPIGSYNNVGKRGCEKRINWKRKLQKDRSHQKGEAIAAAAANPVQGAVLWRPG